MSRIKKEKKEIVKKETVKEVKVEKKPEFRYVRKAKLEDYSRRGYKTASKEELDAMPHSVMKKSSNFVLVKK